MARTPSQTPQEIEAQLPSRPIRVDSNNRQTVRKWMVAHGLPTTFVYGLSMTELGLAYNDPTGDGFAKVRRKYEDIPAEDRERAERDDSEPVTTPTPVTQSQAPAVGGDIISAIQAIAASVVPTNTSIDADAVRTIVREELPNLVPVVRIEIAKADGDTVNLGDRPMHAKFPILVKALAAGCHVMLVGPAGSGKTTAAEMAFQALSREFRIEGAVSGEHKLTGFVDGYGKYHTTPFRDAFEHGHGFIKDEIDGDDSTGLLAMNSALANGSAAFPDSPAPVLKGDGFQVVACANTWGLGADRQYVGRNQLDAATLDRFVTIHWDYDEKLEAALCANADWLARVQKLRRAAFAEKARIVISPRASIHGAKLLAAGIDWNDVEEMTVWKGADSELRRRIEARA